MNFYKDWIFNKLKEMKNWKKKQNRKVDKIGAQCIRVQNNGILYAKWIQSLLFFLMEKSLISISDESKFSLLYLHSSKIWISTYIILEINIQNKKSC